jgi:hypothetical protein
MHVCSTDGFSLLVFHKLAQEPAVDRAKLDQHWRVGVENSVLFGKIKRREMKEQIEFTAISIYLFFNL